MTTPQSSAEKRPSGPGPVTVARLAADLAGGTTIQDVIEQAHAMEHARPMPCRVVYLDYRGPRGDRKLSGEAADLIWSALRPMATPQSSEDGAGQTPDITVRDLAAELGLTHYQVQVRAATVGPDTDIYRSHGEFAGDSVLTGSAADAIREDTHQTQRARCQDPFCETSGYAHSQGPTCRPQVQDSIMVDTSGLPDPVSAVDRLNDALRASGRSAVLPPDASGHVLGRDHGRPLTPPAAGEPLLATGLDVRWHCLTTEPHAPHRGSVELEVDGTEYATKYRCEGVRGLPLGMQPLTETPLLTDLASLLVRMEMDRAYTLPCPRVKPEDREVLLWAVKRAGHLFSHHDLWDYDLVTDEDHFPRCVSHRHLNRTLKDLIPDG